MRKAFYIVAIAALALGGYSQAQTGLTAITASNGVSVGGKPIAAGKVLLTPVDVKGQPISFVSGGGGGLNAPKAFSCTITGGVITPSCQVPDACLTTPANILYNIDVTATANFVTFRLPTVVNICGTSWPLDQYAPPAHTTTTQAMLVAYGTAAPPNPCANATMYVQNASGGLLWICVNSVPVEVTGGSGGGAVDTIGITSANGVSGTSSGGSTPLLTITLGDITPTSINVTDSTKPTQWNFTPTTHPTATKAGAASIGVDTVTTAGVYLLPQAPGSGVYTGTNAAGKVITTFTPLQGTDTKVLSAGTVSGTAATLCTDAQGGATTVGCPAAGGSAAGPLGAVQVAGASGALAQAVGDVNYQSVASTPLGGSQNSIQIIANAAIDQNQFFFFDGTPGWSAGPAYASFGTVAEDFTYTVLMNPSKFTAAQVLNNVAKLVAASDSHGVISPAAAQAGGIGIQWSGLDLNHAFTSGPGASVVGLLCYVHFQKTGTTGCYTTYVAALKTSQAFRPINGTSHLPTVVIGANEYVPGSLFLEQMRFSGDIANASVLLAAYDAAMLKMATAAGDSANVTFFTTNLSQVTTSIQSEFIDGTTHMLLGSTGVDNQIDVLSSGMAVWFSQYLNTPILTLTQQKAIGTFLHTNLATITHNGYFANVVTSGGAVTSWTILGTIPSGGGSSYTSACSGSNTTYHNGYWSLVTGMAASALYLTNPSDVPTLLAGFRDSLDTGGGDPAQEYYTQTFGTNSGSCGTATTPNMESPQSAAWAAANLIGPTSIPAGPAVVDKYGAVISAPLPAIPGFVTAQGGTGLPPLSGVALAHFFACNTNTTGCITVQNTNVSGGSALGFADTVGAVKSGFGYANTSFALGYLAGKTYFFGTTGLILTGNVGVGPAISIDTSNNVTINNGFTGTKTAGSCVFAIAGGVITNVTGC